MTLNIVCLDSNDYQGRGLEYVQILHDSVRRNLPDNFPGRFIVMSDYRDDYGRGIIVNRSLPGHLIGWFNKIALFKDGLFPRGDRILYLDLDTVITGKLDDLVAYDGPLALLRDFYRPLGAQSSVMAWKAGQHTEIWDSYVDESFPNVPGGDQAWIEAFSPAVLQDSFPSMFASYKAHNCRSAPPKEASVIVFHGKPRPHECGGWVPNVWKVGGGTTAMLESVCNTDGRTILENCKDALKRSCIGLSGWPAHAGTVAIVGGGPSLPDNLKSIPNGAEVVALNAAATYLLDRNISCVQMILDARPEMADMLDKRASGYILASQCHPAVFDNCPRIPVIFHPNVPGLAELLPRDTPLIGGGTTVGLQAMVVADLFGCRKIHLIGMDSSYRDDEGHAYAQPLNDNDGRIEVTVAGKTYSAAPWMAQQAEEFQGVASALANKGCEIVVHGDGLLPAVAHEMARMTGLAERGIIEPNGSPACQRASEIAKRMTHVRNPVGAEIGVFRGHMSRRLLAYMPGLHLLMVDSWGPSSADSAYAKTGDFHAGMSPEQQEEFMGEAQGNIAFADDRAKIMRMSSVDAAADVLPGCLDFVFIDADHSEEGCAKDIEAWLPKLNPNGLLCGHDYDNPYYDFGVKRAVDKFIARTGMTLELGQNYTWFARLNSPALLAA